MQKEIFVDSLVDYFQKKTSNTMSKITSEDDILLDSTLDSFYGSYYDYGDYILSILYLREDYEDSIVVCTINKDSSDIICWENIVRGSILNDIEKTNISNGTKTIDIVIQTMENDY